MDEEQAQEMVRNLQAITQELTLLGVRNGEITVLNGNLARRNDELVQRNGVNAVDMRAAQGRIEALERALQDGGAPINGGGGPQVGDPNAPAAPARGPMNPRMPTLTFEGREEDDWLSFRAAFTNAALFSGFTQVQARRALKGCMRSAAFLSIQNIDHEDDDITAEMLLDMYEAKFVPAAASDLSRAKFETAMQLQAETILAWHGRLQSLFVRAYGHGGAMGEQLLVRAFARGIRLRRVREHVLRSQPENYDNALNAAQTEQAVIDSGSFIPGSAPATVGNVAGQRNRGANHQHEPMEIGAMGSAGVQCHLCKQFGHYQRECPKKGIVAAPVGGARPRPAGGAAGTSSKTPFRKANIKGDEKKKHYKRFITAISNAVQGFNEDDGDDGEPEEEEESPADDPDEVVDDSGEEEKDFQ